MYCHIVLHVEILQVSSHIVKWVEISKCAIQLSAIPKYITLHHNIQYTPLSPSLYSYHHSPYVLPYITTNITYH
jgi:hypothetical protein